MAEDYSLPQEVEKYDPDNMRQDILQMPSQVSQGYQLGDKVDLAGLEDTHFSDVIIIGMGGSSIAGLILKDYLQTDPLKLVINQDYSLPVWAGQGTLVIACSYSGNTEETLSAFKEARRRGCGLVIVTVGGKLEEQAKVTRLPIVKIPSGHQPRSSMPVQFFVILRILERLRLVSDKGAEVGRVAADLKAQAPGIEKNAISLSEKVAGRTPLVYTSSKFSSVGYRWKCQFNENAKTPGFCHTFSELNHNEMDGFENLNASFHAVFLRFEDDFRRVQQRMDLTRDILLKRGVAVTDIGIRGPTRLSKMFAAVLLGDLTTYFLALRLRTNPSKVDLIEEFKRKLGPFVV
ncbi:bifunctional phosphoglucose/phosphomannose isomerase [Candidatus Woesearchaeota archaeon]|nr:bifunctional phosphoglucose/phosphomannose isomerase [Candidatus Woesearchaeota archaeon]